MKPSTTSFSFLQSVILFPLRQSLRIPRIQGFIPGEIVILTLTSSLEKISVYLFIHRELSIISLQMKPFLFIVEEVFPLFLLLLQLGFRYGWSFIDKPLPKTYFYDSPGVVITSVPYSNHIYHMLEGVGLLFHKLFSSEELPYVRHSFLFHS